MKQLHYISLLLVSLIGLPACSLLDTAGEMAGDATSYFLGGDDNKEPPAELVDYTSEIAIEVLWEESIGSGAESQFLNLIVAVNDGQVFAANKSGLLQARDRLTGDLIWEADTDYQFSAGPGISRKYVIMATSNAEVVAFDIKTGEQRWQAFVSSEVLASPVISNDIVIIRTMDGKLVALNTEEGSQLWVFERQVPALSIRGMGSVVIVDGHVIAGYANGKLLALQIDNGKNSWETSVAIPSGRSEVERLVDLDADPVETDGVIFISSYSGGTTAILEGDGDVLWRNEDVSSFLGSSYDWRYLYISDTQSYVWQLDQRNGASLWKQKELHHRMLSAPLAYSEYIVVGDYDGYVHWLSSDDGRQLGRVKIAGSAIHAKAVEMDDVVYIYAKDGSLTALKIQTLSESD